MANQSRTTLKTYFNTGDTPTEAQFIDLIDSVPNTTDDGTVATLAGTETLTNKTIDASQLSGTIADARVAQSNVTQHQAALSITESQISDLGTSALLTTDIGTSVQGYDADTLKADTTDQLTVGYTATLYDGGNTAAGSFTPSFANGQFQEVENTGAFTLAVPTASSGTASSIVLLIQNGTGAGAITLTSWTATTGDGNLTTTVGHEFLAFINVCNLGGTTFSHVNFVALQ